MKKPDMSAACGPQPQNFLQIFILFIFSPTFPAFFIISTPTPSSPHKKMKIEKDKQKALLR